MISKRRRRRSLPRAARAVDRRPVAAQECSPRAALRALPDLAQPARRAHMGRPERVAPADVARRRPRRIPHRSAGLQPLAAWLAQLRDRIPARHQPSHTAPTCRYCRRATGASVWVCGARSRERWSWRGRFGSPGSRCTSARRVWPTPSGATPLWRWQRSSPREGGEDQARGGGEATAAPVYPFWDG